MLKLIEEIIEKLKKLEEKQKILEEKVKKLEGARNNGKKRN